MNSKGDVAHGAKTKEGAAVNGPLVTFALFTYNQERFVREAIRGAFAQTYSPLEILISDDCSRDGTFDAIREEVEGYDGPHRVVLNRNERNLGIGGHINRVMELAEGDLIVAAAGDDVSLPTRTEELARVWSGGEGFSVYSNYTIVDENGLDRGVEEGDIASESTKSWQEKVRSGVMRGLGCAHAWDRAVFDTFGPLPDNIVQEDVAIPFRAALLGKVAYIDKRLAKYRRHGANVWKRRDDLLEMDLSKFVRQQIATARSMRMNWESWLHDVRRFSSLHPEMKDELLWASEVIVARVAFYGFKESALAGRGKGRLRDCLRTIKRVRKLGLKAVAKVVLLGVSPTAYCKMHYRLYRSRAPERA